MSIKESIKNILIVLAVVIVATSLFIISAGANIFDAYGSFIMGLLSLNGIGETLVKAAPLILTSLGCAVAFKTGFFNIGAEGQFYIGALAATAVALALPFQGFLNTMLSMLAAFVAGGIYAAIPALLKTKLQISEVITTIMLNYIAINLIGLAVRTFLMDPAGSVPQSARVDSATTLPLLLLPTRINLGIVIALMAVFVVWFIMDKTTLGFEMKSVGFNNRAAKVSGISIIKSVIISALLGGGLAAIAGSVEVLGIQKKLVDGISSDVGYTAVLISLLCKNNPLLVAIVSLLYAALSVGAATMQRQTGVPSSIVNIIMGLVVILILAKDLFVGKKEAN